MIDPRASLAVRLYGASIVFFAIKTYATQSWETLWAPGGWAFHSFCIGGGLALGLGPRPWVLLLCALATLRCWVSAFRPDEPLVWFPAAEWPLFVGLPWLTLTGWAFQLRDRQSWGWISTWVCRVSLASAMALAAVHKLNWDFFDPALSCARLNERLSQWWALPTWAHGWTSPAVVIALEGLTPVLLFARPRWGFGLLLVLMVHFGSIGATALAWVMVAMGIAFLPMEDVECGVHWGRKNWQVLTVLAGAVGAVSWALYQGPWSWPQYGVFHALSAVLVACWVASWRTNPNKAPSTASSPTRARWYVAVWAVIWCLNGVAPYFGWKFQYSFAMLSNLRVDAARWNSMWIPRPASVAPMAHVEILRVMYRSASTGRPLRGGALEPGFHSADSLRTHIKRAEELGEWITMDFEYQGEAYRYLHAPPHLTAAFVRALPPSGWLQPVLSREGGQTCVH